MAARLVRKHPVTGLIEERCYYVIVGGQFVGRVRYNDGWNASLWTGDGFDPLAGSWRTRHPALLDLLDAVEA